MQRSRWWPTPAPTSTLPRTGTGTGSCVPLDLSNPNGPDGPTSLTGFPATGPCCTVGQATNVVSVGVGFSGGAPLYDLGFRSVIPNTIAACNAGIHAVTISAVIGIALVGILNFGVSFALALAVAFRAKEVDNRERVGLAVQVGKAFLRHPLRFFVPPKVSA